MQLRGLVGHLRRGYVVAVELGPYTVTRTKDDASCALTATVIQVVDPFQLAQPGLRFVTPLASKHWSWAVEAHAIVGDTLTARLGARPTVE